MHSENSIALVSLALDASLMRQTAIAKNIANINSTDYQTIRVNFEQQLSESLLTGDLPQETIKPRYELSDHQSSIDEQMALNVANMTHYRALIKGLNQKLSIMKLALHGMNQ